mmetsp:Transcript_87091/g.254860  ORF Transcript_87091/g.254860 Transcript_87091/m.254860 type:complete len:363 (+) Transcript_87091:827-1915(+)
MVDEELAAKVLRQALHGDVVVPPEQALHVGGKVALHVALDLAEGARRHPGVGPVGDLRDHAEAAAAPAQGAEEVGVLVARAGADDAAVGEHDLCLDHVGGARAVHAAVVAVAASQRGADEPHGGAGAAHHGAPVGRGLVVELPVLDAGAQGHGAADVLGAGVGREAVQPLGAGESVRPELQVAASRQRSPAKPLVARALDRHCEAMLARKLHCPLRVLGAVEGGHLGWEGALVRPALQLGAALHAAELEASWLVGEPEGIRVDGVRVDRPGLLHVQDGHSAELLPRGFVEARHGVPAGTQSGACFRPCVKRPLCTMPALRTPLHEEGRSVLVTFPDGRAAGLTVRRSLCDEGLWTESSPAAT